jgi:transposase
VGRRYVRADERLGGPLPAGRPIRLAIVKREGPGVKVLKRRWVVERTIAWLGGCRRLSKDSEGTTGSSEARVTLAMIHLMARRLVKKV